MPQRPPRHVIIGATPHEIARESDRRRGSASSRGYDRAWQKVRDQHLQLEPLCRFCGQAGIVRAATVVDHIRTIEERPDLRLDHANLRSLCKPHHDSRTATEQVHGRRYE